MRELSLPQIKLLIKQADRRDAQRHLHEMQNVHAAIAPLMVGDNGKELMDDRREALSRIANDVKEPKKDKAFALMWALANRQSQQT